MGMNVTVAQPSFAAGELSPSLRARTDLAKYRIGLALCENYFIQSTGGAASRAGLKGVLRSKTTVASAVEPRVVGFTFSVTQTYILEFGDLFMRVIMNGGYVLETAQSITSITPAATTTINKVAHGYAIGDWIFFSSVLGATQLNSAAPGKLGVILAAGFGVNAFRIGTIDGALIDSTTWGAFVSGNMARVLTVASPYTGVQLPLMKFSQNADTLTITIPGVVPRNLTRSSHTSWTFTSVSWNAAVQKPTAVIGTALNPGGVGGQNFDYRYVITSVYDLTSEESVPSTPAELVVNKNLSTDVRLQNQLTWTAPASGPTPDRYYIYGARAYLTSGASQQTVFGYIGQTDKTNLNFQDGNIDPDFTRGPPKHYDPFGDYGNPGCSTYFGGRKWYGGSNIAPEVIVASQSGNYSNADYHIPVRADDGLVLGLLSSQVNQIKHLLSLNNLLALCVSGAWVISSDQNDAGLTALSVRARPQIYDGAGDVAPLNVSSDVLYATSALTAIRTLAYDFSSNLFTGVDITLLASHLFIGYTVQAMAYAAAPFSLVYTVRSDGVMPVMSYLKEQDVYAWTHWVTPGNGGLGIGTDDFIDCACIREGTEDVLYVVVKRTSPGVNGGLPYYIIERLASRSWYDGMGNVDKNLVSCLDSFVEYSGVDLQTLSGLDHAIGSTVYVYADGAMQGPKVVDATGTITIDHVANRIVVGFPYTPQLQTLRLDFGDQQSVTGKRKKVSRATMAVTESRGITVAPMKDDLAGNSIPGTFYPFRERNSQQTYSTALPYLEGVRTMLLEPTMQSDGSLFVRGTPGVPHTILSIVPTVMVGDDNG